MKPRARFAMLALIPLGCAFGENTTPPSSGFDSGGNGNEAGGGVIPSNSGTANAIAGTGGSAAAGETSTAGTFNSAGAFGLAGGGTGGMAGATSTAGSGGTPSAGSAGMPSAGTAGTGGTPPVTGPYCDGKPTTPLPFVVNEGFQPSGWQGDFAAISAPTVAPDACTARPTGAVGTCSVWRFTPNATTPAWAGVSWSKVWDAQFTHENICLAAGATKVTFQARGAAGDEQVVFSAAGAPEVPLSLTNAWKKYEISLSGVVYNSDAEGVASGFFWKVVPPTPGGAAVTFFVDDIQFVK